MLVFDEITIIISAALIVLAILGSLVNPFLRKVSTDSEDEEEEGDTQIPLTVIITAHDNARELDKNLPSILQQDYPQFKVIVVAEEGDEETKDLLKRMASDSHLYSTFIPATSRYMSRKKLAITLGVKAAKTEWVILTDPTLQPASNQWLRMMAHQCKDGNNLVMGYTQYDNETSDYRRFLHLRHAYYLLRRAIKSTALCTNMQNVAFRKSEFIEGYGYQGNLHLLRGEYDFLVNKYANETGTAVQLDPKAWLIEEEPTNRTWNNRNLFYLASRPYLERITSMRVLRFFDHLLPHLSLLASVAFAAWSGITQNWIVLAASVVSLLILFFVRMALANSAMNQFEEDIPAIKLPFYEYSVIWHIIANRLRFWRADKRDFTSHKQ